MNKLSDEEWLEANLNPRRTREELNISIPDLPPDDVQIIFTARAGRENLQQAFDFYRFVLDYLPQGEQGRYSILDFGGGWGRVLRFFLREFPAERLILVDCLTSAIEYANSLNPPFTVMHNDAMPPLPLPENSVEVCFAFSVFSHLSEQACTEWLTQISKLLVPGGKSIFTTRGTSHIKYLHSLVPDRSLLRTIKGILKGKAPNETQADPILKLLPKPETLLTQYEKGVFQFYPTGDDGELNKSFYGEAWIPEAWMKTKLPALGYSDYRFFQETGTIDQCIFVLTK